MFSRTRISPSASAFVAATAASPAELPSNLTGRLVSVGEVARHRSQRVLRVRPALRSAEVREEHDACASIARGSRSSGSAARIRVSSPTVPSASSGTLKSTRTSARLALINESARSATDFFCTGCRRSDVRCQITADDHAVLVGQVALQSSPSDPEWQFRPLTSDIPCPASTSLPIIRIRSTQRVA